MTQPMNAAITIQRATASDVPEIAAMVGELLAEIMHRIDEHAFNFDLNETTTRLEDFIAQKVSDVAYAGQESTTHRGWKRLEVTTPPLPQFDNTLAFYRREGFAITGGRKLKRVL